jgi:mono/diheme cytochrome c family protein
MITLALAASAALALAADPPAAAPAATAPPAPTAAEIAAAEPLVALSCQTCHDGSMLAQQRLTLKQWQTTVAKMRGWGALLADHEADLLARALAAKYAPDTPPVATPTIAAADAARAVAPLPDGPYANGAVAAGKRLFADICSGCHGDDARGMSPAPNLVDRVILQRAPEIALMVKEGRGRMPPQALTDRDIAAVIAYLRTLEK